MRTRSKSRDTQFCYAEIESPKRKSSVRRSLSAPRAKGSQDENAAPRASVAKKKPSLKRSKSTNNLAEVDAIEIPQLIELNAVVKQEFPEIPTTSKPLTTKNTNVVVKQVHPPACSSASMTGNITVRNPSGRPRRTSVQEKNGVQVQKVVIPSKPLPVMKPVRRQSTVSAPKKPPAMPKTANVVRKVVIKVPPKVAPAKNLVSFASGSLVGRKVVLNQKPSTSSTVSTASGSGSQPKVVSVNSPKTFYISPRNLSTIPEVSQEVSGIFFPGASSTPRVFGSLTVTAKKGNEMNNFDANKNEETAHLKNIIQKQKEYVQMQKEYTTKKEIEVDNLKHQLMMKEQNIQKMKRALGELFEKLSVYK